MNAEQFESIAMKIGIAILIGFMFFIIYDLAKRSNSGKLGMGVLFFALGLGMVGFLVKIVIQYMMEV